MKKLNIAVIGATGLVGTKIIEMLANSSINFDNIYFFASYLDAGKKIVFRGQKYIVEEASKRHFDQLNLDVVFLAAGSEASKYYVEYFVRRKVYVIDNSSYYRMKNQALLVVPEVNGDVLSESKYLISNPNCSTIQSVLPIKVIKDLVGIKKIIYSTYQAVSGSGERGIASLEGGINYYKYPIKNNLIPQIDVFSDYNYTAEEIKMINETKKILNDYLLDVSATCVRVPIVNSHSVDVLIEFEKALDIEVVREKMMNSKGIKVIDSVDNELYPMPLISTGKNDILVGRLRKPLVFEHGIRFFCVGDNLLKGAALNAYQILEELIRKGVFDV